MKAFLFLSSLALASQCSTTYAAGDRVLVCYWGSWSHYRQGHGKFSVDQIDPTLCTHLVYAFAKLENGVIAAYDSYLDLAENWGLGMYRKFNALKQRNPRLKTLIAIGGWNEGSVKYSQMASTQQGRTKFVNSVLDFLDKHGFDGLDFDWEYPAARGGRSTDRDTFSLLLSELRAALDAKRYLLTAAVSAGKATIDQAYDVPSLSRFLHLINLMTYDYFGSWNPYTGHNSPLGARVHASEEERIFNVKTTVKHWIAKGAEPGKLTLGLPLYGRSFTLADPANVGFGAKTNGPGPAGDVTKQAGYLGYNEICTMLSSGGWKITRDPNVAAPVAVKNRLWIGYDDVESLKNKVNFAKSMGLAGAMVWSIETDDFSGRCSGIKRPLLTAISSTLQGRQFHVNVPPKPNPPAPATARRPTAPPTMAPPVPNKVQKEEGKCTADGYFPHPNNRSKFYRCVPNVHGEYDLVSFDCPPATVYDAALRVCTHP